MGRFGATEVVPRCEPVCAYMHFDEIVRGVETLERAGGNPPITGVEYDSRRVGPGNLFVAMKGESSDGNRFIAAAIAAGASAVVTDSANEPNLSGLPWARVPHGRRALAIISANFYEHPAQQLAITGITGTNGKSSTAFLLEAMLAAAGRQSLLIGTIEYHVAGRVLPAPHTTPEALELNQLFAQAIAAGAKEAVMEVSSHALAQGRVFGIAFDVAVFTNLTRDHLDYHHTMEEYFAAKRVLFEGWGERAPHVSVLNLDDEYGERLVQIGKSNGSEVITYGMTQGDFHAENVRYSAEGTRFHMVTPAGDVGVASPLLGRVNVYNALAAASAAFARGCDLLTIANGVATFSGIPGRFQRVHCGQPFTVVVDYAHTDDALRNLTTLAREFVAGKSRVITLFGCGGDRDRAKRPLMGEAAGRGSDFVILTSDNPRSEDPLAIMNDAVVGLQRSGTKYVMEPDRRSAIHLAIAEARAGDIVLLAGKGHEKTQVTRTGSVPFDDVEVAREALTQAGYECAAAGKP